MFTSSSVVEVNPPGSHPTLTPDQVWEVLLAKARSPIGIVAGATRSEVVEEYPDGFLRQMTVGDRTIRERITITPRVQVLFTRVETSGHEGFIANTLSDLDGRPVLTFTVAVEFPGVEPGSPEEQAAGGQIRQAYQAAMRTVLDRARQASGA